MSNKFLNSLSEDPQLEKQMGCMAGILQLFDRHQVLAGRRFHKRIASGAKSSPASTCGSPRSDGNESSSHDLQCVEEIPLRHAADSPAVPEMGGSKFKASSQVLDVDHDMFSPSPFVRSSARAIREREEPRMSLDISSSGRPARTLDSSRSLHEGRLFHDVKGFSGKQLDATERVKGLSRCKEVPRFSTDSKDVPLDVRDIVRASFMKDASKLSVDRKGAKGSSEVMRGVANASKTLHARRKAPSSWENYDSKSIEGANSLKEFETANCLGRDLPKSVCKLKETSRAPADGNESLRSLGKLREAPWNFLDTRDARFSSMREVARKSCDVREPQRASSVDFKELKSMHKLKEAPRLSLDGRLAPPAGLLKDCAKLKEKVVARLSGQTAVDRILVSAPSLKVRGNSFNNDLDTDSAPAGKRTSTTNVVARLMGLEEMPTPSKSETFEKLSFNSEAQESHAVLNSCEHQPGSKKFPCAKITEVDAYGSPTKRRQGENWSFSTSETQGKMDLDSAGFRAGTAKVDQHRKVGQGIYPEKHWVSRSTPNGTFSERDLLTSERPTSKLGHQIEQVQKTVALYKDVEKSLKMLGSQDYEQDLLSLEKLYQVLELEDDAYASRLKFLALHQAGRIRRHRTTVTPDCSSTDLDSSQHDSVRMGSGSPEWIAVRVPDKQGITPEHSRPTSPVKACKRIGGNSVQACDVNNVHAGKPSAKIGRSRCSSPDKLPSASDPRFNVSVNKKVGVQSIVGLNDATGNRLKNGSSTRTSSDFYPAVRNPSAQLSASTSNGDGFSSSGRSPCPAAKGDSVKQSKKIERCKKDKSPPCIVKDKEESRANLISLKSQSLGRASSAQIGRRMQNSKPLEATINLRTDALRRPNCEKDSNNANLKNALNNRSTSPLKASDSSHGAFQLDANYMVAPRNERRDAPSPSRCLSDETTEISENNRPQKEPEPDAGQRICSHVKHTSEPGWAIEQNTHKNISLSVGKDYQEKKATDKVLQLLEQQREDVTEKFLATLDQPSPVSVLDASFYQEDPSPMACSKRILHFEEVDAGIADAQHEISLESFGTSSTSDADGGAEDVNFWPARLLPNNSTYSQILECEAMQIEHYDKEGAKADIDYVREVLATAALAGSSPGTGGIGITDDGPMEGHLFFTLESKRNEGVMSSASMVDKGGDASMCTWEEERRAIWRRRLLFDAVNCSLKRRLREWLILEKQPWIMGSLWWWPTSGKEGNLFKGVWDDIGRMRRLGQRSAGSDVEEEAGEDIAETPNINSNWEDDLPDSSSEQGFIMVVERGEIALELERLIFKDLIANTIRDLAQNKLFA